MKQPRHGRQHNPVSGEPYRFDRASPLATTPLAGAKATRSLLSDLIETHHAAELHAGRDTAEAEAHRRARQEALLAVDPGSPDAPSIDLELLVRDSLRAFRFGEADGIRIEGPACCLRAPAALLVALTLQELATNSIKFGMLGAEARGQALRVSWRWSPNGVEFRWRETGVPILRLAGSVRNGFGRRLMESVLPQYLSPTTGFTLLPGGVRFTAMIPYPACGH